MEDLGWLCVRAWRFGGVFPAAGLGTYDELFDAYASVAGVRPDPDVVRWWETLGTVKWGIICISQAAPAGSWAGSRHGSRGPRRAACRPRRRW